MSLTQDLDDILQTQDQSSPIILLVGPPRSGKTSIQRVIFSKLSPHESQFLDPTTQPNGIHYPSNDPRTVREALLRCRVIDLPGTFFKHYTRELLVRILKVSAYVIFVIDAANENSWQEATQYLINVLSTMEMNDIQCPLAVLLHKIDLDNSTMTDVRVQYTDLRRNLLDAFRQNNIRLGITFHVTSLFDITIHECLSRIFQQVLPQTNLIGSLLDGFISACGIEKAYLVDSNSKLYLATDSLTPDVLLYQLLCDMIDLTFDIGLVYTPADDDEDEDDEDDDGEGLNGDGGVLGRKNENKANKKKNNNNNNKTNNGNNNNNNTNNTNTTNNNNTTTSNNNNNTTNNNNNNNNNQLVDADEDFDCYTSETILQNGLQLSLRQLNDYLSLLYTFRPNPSAPTTNRGTIEYNITCFKQALSRIFNISFYGVPHRAQPTFNNSFHPQGVGSPQSPNGAGGDFGMPAYMGSLASTSQLANFRAMFNNPASLQGGNFFPQQQQQQAQQGNQPSSFANPPQNLSSRNANQSGRQQQHNNNNNNNNNQGNNNLNMSQGRSYG